MVRKQQSLACISRQGGAGNRCVALLVQRRVQRQQRSIVHVHERVERDAGRGIRCAGGGGREGAVRRSWGDRPTGYVPDRVRAGRWFRGRVPRAVLRRRWEVRSRRESGAAWRAGRAGGGRCGGCERSAGRARELGESRTTINRLRRRGYRNPLCQRYHRLHPADR